MIDAPVHAALLVLFAWLVRLAANALGFDLTESAYSEIAGIVVAYILSLFGLGIWTRSTAKSQGLRGDGPQYVPPFAK